MAAEYFSKHICRDATVENGAERHEKKWDRKTQMIDGMPLLLGAIC